MNICSLYEYLVMFRGTLGSFQVRILRRTRAGRSTAVSQRQRPAITDEAHLLISALSSLSVSCNWSSGVTTSVCCHAAAAPVSAPPPE